jgi:hypothetical protein
MQPTRYTDLAIEILPRVPEQYHLTSHNLGQLTRSKEVGHQDSKCYAWQHYTHTKERAICPAECFAAGTLPKA